MPDTLSPLGETQEFWNKIKAKMPVSEESRSFWTGAAITQLMSLGFPVDALGALSTSPTHDSGVFVRFMQDHFTPDYSEPDEEIDT